MYAQLTSAAYMSEMDQGTQQEAPPLLLGLPPHVLDKVLAGLAPTTLGRLGTACRVLQELVEQADDIWQAHCLSFALTNADGLPWAQRYARHARLLCRECRQPTRYVHAILRCRLCPRCEHTSTRYALVTHLEAVERYGLPVPALDDLPSVESFGLHFCLASDVAAAVRKLKPATSSRPGQEAGDSSQSEGSDSGSESDGHGQHDSPGHVKHSSAAAGACTPGPQGRRTDPRSPHGQGEEEEEEDGLAGMSDVGEGDAQQQAAAMSAAQARRAQEKAARKAAKKQVKAEQRARRQGAALAPATPSSSEAARHRSGGGHKGRHSAAGTSHQEDEASMYGASPNGQAHSGWLQQHPGRRFDKKKQRHREAQQQQQGGRGGRRGRGGMAQSYEEEAGAAFPLEGMLGSSPKSLGHTKSRWLQQRERLAREYGEYAITACVLSDLG